MNDIEIELEERELPEAGYCRYCGQPLAEPLAEVELAR